MALAGARHIGLKVVSIGLASLLWLLVSGEQVVERALRIPLEYTNVPPDLELVEDAPTVVDVRLRGSSGALGRVTAGEMVAVLDLAEARPPQRIFHLTPAHVRTPFGVEVVQVQPSSIVMRFERSRSKMVPVVPPVDGMPAPGFVVGTVTANPAAVEIVGPESALDTVTEAITEAVSVAGRAASFSETVTIGSPDPAVRLRTPQAARVAVSITAAPIEWSVAGVPVQVVNGSRPTSVVPKVVTVFVRGPREASAVRASEFFASVDVAGLRAGRFDLAIQVVPPARVGVVRVEPEQVRVTIR